MENFEACWHSYHLECLTDSNVCPICRVGFFLFMQIDQLIPQETQQVTMMKISLTENRV